MDYFTAQTLATSRRLSLLPVSMMEFAVSLLTWFLLLEFLLIYAYFLDCCDASDEYSSSANCPNNCMELGEQMREERERYLELVKAGNEIRQRYIEEAKQKLGETKQELEALRSQLTEAEEQKNAKNEIKTKAEELEKEALDKHRAEEDKLRKQREEEEQIHREAAENSYALSIFKKLDTNADGVVSYEELKAFPAFDQDNNGEVTDDEARVCKIENF